MSKVGESLIEGMKGVRAFFAKDEETMAVDNPEIIPPSTQAPPSIEPNIDNGASVISDSAQPPIHPPSSAGMVDVSTTSSFDKGFSTKKIEMTVPRDALEDNVPGADLAAKEATLEEIIEDITVDKFGEPDGDAVGGMYKVDIDCETPETPIMEIKHFCQEDSVNGVQQHLIGRGHEGVGNKYNMPDGMFGNGSSYALEQELKDVQERNGITPSGEYNADTRAALIIEMEKIPENNEAMRDSMQGFIDGLDALKDNILDNGNSALDTVYHPGVQPKGMEECTVTLSTTANIPPQYDF